MMEEMLDRPLHLVGPALFAMLAIASAGACGDSGASDTVSDGGLAADAPTSTPTASSTATVGPAGGVIAAAGVTVTIPAGALGAPLDLTLTRYGDREMSLTPHVDFLVPVKVRFDGMGTDDRLVLRQRDDGVVDELGEPFDEAGGAAFLTSSFSCHHLAKLAALGADGWKEGTSLAGGDVANTRIPDGITHQDVTAACLTSVKDDGFREDSITKVASRTQDEAHLMTEEAAAALRKVRQALPGAGLGDYDLWLTGAWDSSGLVHARTRDPEGKLDAPKGSEAFTGRLRDRHYYGAAIDVVLCKKSGQGCLDDTAKVHDVALGKLAALMAASGFTWVWWEPALVCDGTLRSGAHVHASISSPSLVKCKLRGTWQGDFQIPGCTSPHTVHIKAVRPDGTLDVSYVSGSGMAGETTIPGSFEKGQLHLFQPPGFTGKVESVKLGATIDGTVTLTAEQYPPSGLTYKAPLTKTSELPTLPHTPPASGGCK